MIPSNASQNRASLDGVDLFCELSSSAREQVASSCAWWHFEAGEMILNHLDTSDDVFFIVQGGARVILYSDTGKVVSFRDLGPGDTFGEIPAIDRGPRSASVEARTDCTLASMPARVFRELLRAEPVFTLAVLRQQVGAIRRLTTRVQEFSTAVMGITGRRLYSEIQAIRANATYPTEEVKAALLEKSFPRSAEDMTLRLSNVTAAFYGLMLKHVGLQFGWQEIDGLSRRVFQELGRLKTREALENGIDLPADTRAPVVVFITAVHSASPEYNFNVLEYLPETSAIRVFGTSRYDRIAKKLDIEQHLTWPELVPFFQGISDELKLSCRIETDLRDLGDGGRYDCIYRFVTH
jgi:CRP-like cAMP-binding protein